MFVCHSPYISYFFSENAPKDNIFAKFAAVARWSGRITISAETVEVSSKKKKDQRQRKTTCRFCGREDRNRDGCERKQFSGCWHHICTSWGLPASLVQPYKFSYLNTCPEQQRGCEATSAETSCPCSAPAYANPLCRGFISLSPLRCLPVLLRV